MSLEAFVWSDKLLTGLSDVDEQHHQLVVLINQVGAMCTGEIDLAQLKPVLKALAAYTQYHFNTEEDLMRQHHVDARHLESHIKAHEHFSHQVEVAAQILSRNADTPKALVEQLLEYLIKWLTHHIMVTDTCMAREIHALQAGTEPTEASRQAAASVTESTDVLLEALNTLYGKIGEMNMEVLQKNRELEREHQQLEIRVRERTTQLEQEKIQQAALIRKLEEAQNQLLQSEKMASIGQLAAGVAHEINNPIGFVNSNLSSLEKYINSLFQVIAASEAVEMHLGPEDRQAILAVKQHVDLTFLKEDIQELMKESQDGLNRVKRIIQDLKDFSHVDESTWQMADLEKGLDSTLNVVWNEIKYKAEVIKKYAGIPEVECMPSQLNQVFMNLLVNASHAIQERGSITIATGCQDDQVWIEISDTGKGIPPEHMNRIFEPFFTTKPVGQGTGLGLSLSYGIVQKHGGHIEVKSEIGKGTSFRIRLPLKQHE